MILLGGHHTHTKNISYMLLLLCMMCLDVSFMNPHNTYYVSEVRYWLRANPGRVVTESQIAKLRFAFGNVLSELPTCQLL